jgi:hypothetical protein
MDQTTRTRIAAEEESRFLDKNFGGLDLSGSPDLLHPPTETFEAQDRHGFNKIDTSGLPTTNQLRTFIEKQLVRIRDFSKAPATPDFSGVLNLAEVRNRIPRAETPLVRKPADWFTCFAGSLFGRRPAPP